LIQREFLSAVERALAPGGEFLFMTDHEEYFRWAVDKVAGFGRFELLEWSESSFFYPKTDFQQLWESEGKTIWRMRCRKPD
jgi:tRNA (guanine-N7-)-methyltransferase